MAVRIAAASVVGLGNLLVGDDGVGVCVVRRLSELLGDDFPVRLVDGGTLGIDLLSDIEGSSYLIVVDALAAGERPGTVTVLEGRAATSWESRASSAHGLGLPSVLAMARLRGWTPERLAVVGVEPAVVATGVGLSPPVEAAVAEAASLVLQLLQQWGVLPAACEARRAGPGTSCATP